MDTAVPNPTNIITATGDGLPNEANNVDWSRLIPAMAASFGIGFGLRHGVAKYTEKFLNSQIQHLKKDAQNLKVQNNTIAKEAENALKALKQSKLDKEELAVKLAEAQMTFYEKVQRASDPKIKVLKKMRFYKEGEKAASRVSGVLGNLVLQLEKGAKTIRSRTASKFSAFHRSLTRNKSHSRSQKKSGGTKKRRVRARNTRK